MFWTPTSLGWAPRSFLECPIAPANDRFSCQFTRLDGSPFVSLDAEGEGGEGA